MFLIVYCWVMIVEMRLFLSQPSIVEGTSFFLVILLVLVDIFELDCFRCSLFLDIFELNCLQYCSLFLDTLWFLV